MRKISKEAATKFVHYANFAQNNTKVTQAPNGNTIMYLHGNRIASCHPTNGTWLSLAGWNTTTTRERLNGIMEVMGLTYRFRQIGGKAYITCKERNVKIEINEDNTYALDEIQTDLARFIHKPELPQIVGDLISDYEKEQNYDY